MGSAIGLRGDFDGTSLRRLARASKSASQARRLLAMAEIYDGGIRSAAARLQIVRDWMVRFNVRGPDRLLDGKEPGKRSRHYEAQRSSLVEVVERGPIPAIHSVVHWSYSPICRTILARPFSIRAVSISCDPGTPRASRRMAKPWLT